MEVDGMDGEKIGKGEVAEMAGFWKQWAAVGMDSVGVGNHEGVKPSMHGIWGFLSGAVAGKRVSDTANKKGHYKYTIMPYTSCIPVKNSYFS